MEISTGKAATGRTKLKRFIIPAIVILCLLAGFAAFYFISGMNDPSGNRKKTKTINSFKEEAPADMYSMTYSGSFCFDDYLKEGFAGTQAKADFINQNLLYSMMPEYEKEPHDCSTFVCRNEKNEVLFCRNFDTSAYFPCCMVTADGADGFKNISAGNLGIAFDPATNRPFLEDQLNILLLALPYFSSDGMNEYGLAISLLSSGSAKTLADDSRKTLSAEDVIRIVLEKAKTVDEAIELLKGYTVDFGPVYSNVPMHFMIADASGRSVVADYSEGEPVFVESSIVTNFNLNGPVRGIGQDRYELIANALSGHGNVLSEEEALQLLADACMKNMERYSVVYNLTTGEVTAFSHGDCSVTAHFRLDMARNR